MTIPPSPTGRQLLIEWAKAQDTWVRMIVGEILATRHELSPAALEAVYKVFLAEKELGAGRIPPLPELSLGTGEGDRAQPFRLARLRDVQNVNVLAPGQEITFNPRLTLLFGENASGKTGYVRILKRLAAVRSAEPVLPDVRTTAGGPARTPRAKISYTMGETEDNIEWNNEAGIPPFTRLGVFDARAVSLHVDEELTYTYTPSDLALFRLTHQAIDAIKARLEAERDAALPQANPFLARFVRGTVVYPKIESLGPSTDLADLQRLADVPEEEERQLEPLRERVEALRPHGLQARLQAARTDRALYATALPVAEAVRSFDSPAYNAAVQAVRTASERYADATERAFAGEEIPGGLRDAWRSFIQAGEAYIEDLGDDNYPQPGSKCIYCRQELAAAALKLVRKYRDYCNNELRRELDAAKEQLMARASRIAALDLRSLQAALGAKAAASENGPEPLIRASLSLVRVAAPIQEQVAKGLAVDPREAQALASEVDALARAAIARADELIATLGAQAEERARALAAESAKLRDLEARLGLRALLPEIRHHVGRAKWASRASTILASFPALLKSLTQESKVASEHLLNQDFERLFRQECAELRAPPVDLDFPGRRGQAARRKVVSPEHRLSEILSEGEQKVIALADFLAEASLSKVPAPIVFDDPVTSLDYKRLRYVADRIAWLSEQRQVVVLTHNIWFAVDLLSKFEQSPQDCTYYEVTDAGAIKGVVTPGTHPRWDTPNKIAGRINALIQEAATASGETREALIERGYSLIRTWCEALVEQELLEGVVERFRPHVRMTCLPKIKADRLPAAFSAILPIFEKACRITEGHSQPLETLGVRPTLEELKEDWKALQAGRQAYRA